MIDDNSQDYVEKMNKYYSKLDKQDSKLDNVIEMIKNMMYQNQNSNHPPEIWIHHRTMVLPLWSQLTRRLYHWKVEILKMVICGLSNMISAHQYSVNSSSIYNSRRHLYVHQ